MKKPPTHLERAVWYMNMASLCIEYNEDLITRSLFVCDAAGRHWKINMLDQDAYKYLLVYIPEYMQFNDTCKHGSWIRKQMIEETAIQQNECRALILITCAYQALDKYE